MTTGVRKYSVEEFVEELRRLPESAFSGTSHVLDFLTGFPVDPASLQSYLVWDHQHYTRNLIDKTPIYELMAICWESGQASSVHNHKDQNCWMAVPIGRLLVENYSVMDQNLHAGRCHIQRTVTSELNPNCPQAVDPGAPIHRVINPKKFNERAVSLHVYSRPFDSCVVYSEENGTCGEIRLSFTSEFGKRPLQRR